MADNKYGLSRYIPEDIKRIIRQRCGFGCVICGNALYDYEHIDPEFHEAKIHDPGCITLLCGIHHQDVTRKFLDKKSVADYNASPFCKRKGIAIQVLHTSNVHPKIIWGCITFDNVKTMLEIFGDAVFSIDPPEEGSDKFLVNARLCDKGGEEILRIEKNQIFILPKNWDATYKAGSIVLKNGKRDTIVDIKVEPPNKLIVQKLHMQHRGIKVDFSDNESFEIIHLNGRKIKMEGELEFRNVSIAFQVTKNGYVIGAGSGGSYMRFSGRLSF